MYAKFATFEGFEPTTTSKVQFFVNTIYLKTGKKNLGKWWFLIGVFNTIKYTNPMEHKLGRTWGWGGGGELVSRRRWLGWMDGLGREKGEHKKIAKNWKFLGPKGRKFS